MEIREKLTGFEIRFLLKIQDIFKNKNSQYIKNWRKKQQCFLKR